MYAAYFAIQGLKCSSPATAKRAAGDAFSCCCIESIDRSMECASFAHDHTYVRAAATSPTPTEFLIIVSAHYILSSVLATYVAMLQIEVVSSGCSPPEGTPAAHVQLEFFLSHTMGPSGTLGWIPPVAGYYERASSAAMASAIFPPRQNPK